MGIITDANEEIRVIPLDRWKSDWEGYATLHAAIRINHPAVMAGTWNVIHVDFCRIVTNWKNDLEMIEENHATVPFLSSTAASTFARLRTEAAADDADE